MAENGTVRDKIILFLKDGKPKHFTDITTGLTKHDYTINRELKILINSNWLLKTGKKPKTFYSLDLTQHDVQEYLKRADVTIPDNSNINEIPVDYEKLNDSDPPDPRDFLTSIFSGYEYLFSWDKIPGDNDGRLKKFLKKQFRADWVETAKIEKVDDGKTIKVSAEKNSLMLRLNNEKTEVSLRIDDEITDNLIAKMEKNKLIICIEKDRIRHEEGIEHEQPFNILNDLEVKNTNVFLVSDKNDKLRFNNSLNKDQYKFLVGMLKEIVEKPHGKPFKIVISYNPKKD